MVEKLDCRAFVGLGSNVGDRRETLASAVRAISSIPLTEVMGASRLYETDPVGPSTSAYLNAVIEVRTGLSPRALLDALLAIEVAHGRRRRVRWEARTLDLDVLVYVDANGGIVKCDEPGLELPHPRAPGRDFVLAPLRDLAPDLVLAGATVEAHLQALPECDRTIRASHPPACYLPGPQAGSSVG